MITERSSQHFAQEQEPQEAHFSCLNDSLQYLQVVLTTVFTEPKTSYYHQLLPPPHLTWDDSFFSNFLLTHQPSLEEFITLTIALVPYLDSSFYTTFLQQYKEKEKLLLLFGGKRENGYGGILPTGETVQFVLAGDDLENRLRLLPMFSAEHWLCKSGILKLEKMPVGVPPLSGRLILGEMWLQLVLNQKERGPAFSVDFPAKLITTELEWPDLVLNEKTQEEIDELTGWLNHRAQLWELPCAKHLKPGYRVLLYGPSGTGKTLTACLIGKSTGKPVYRVDLSLVISKYIGETEKNLSNLFSQAENKDWILFFDEADALFGKRTSVSNAHDRYANQEIAYLLQRIEDYDGLVILASNLKDNIDDAFTRRFQAIIHFPIPNARERLSIWRKLLLHEPGIAEDVNLEDIAQYYELSGASIVNIVEHCNLLSVLARTDCITYSMLKKSIAREFLKEGKRV